MKQQIQYCTAADGVRLAYSVIGRGTPIVRASHWLSHLEYDLESPVFRPMVLGLSQRHAYLRYDARGTGLSQRDVGEISMERWVSDLETVVDAVALDRFILYGASQGAAISIAYAARHPERVSHLILSGGWVRGQLHRENPDKQRRMLELSRTMVREGWGSDQEAYRQWFTSQIMPDATREQMRWFNDLERVSATPEVAERIVQALAEANVAELLPKVQAPTLVLHCRGDQRVPFAQGQEIAAGISGARLVPLPGNNHIFLAHETAHRAFFEAVYVFLGDPPIKGALPGAESLGERLHGAVAKIESSWVYKLVAIAASVAGIVAVLLALFA